MPVITPPPCSQAPPNPASSYTPLPSTQPHHTRLISTPVKTARVHYVGTRETVPVPLDPGQKQAWGIQVQKTFIHYTSPKALRTPPRTEPRDFKPDALWGGLEQDCKEPRTPATGHGLLATPSTVGSMCKSSFVNMPFSASGSSGFTPVPTQQFASAGVGITPAQQPGFTSGGMGFTPGQQQTYASGSGIGFTPVQPQTYPSGSMGFTPAQAQAYTSSSVGYTPMPEQTYTSGSIGFTPAQAQSYASGSAGLTPAPQPALSTSAVLKLADFLPSNGSRLLRISDFLPPTPALPGSASVSSGHQAVSGPSAPLPPAATAPSSMLGLWPEQPMLQLDLRGKTPHVGEEDIARRLSFGG
eukprot:CAMPEP_0172662940 /NCGR_PEP_ID=MMETSP1074-20121228/5629_1 /TAXON_ID=2916 /ORGANISM="Ceratium fusus, Strain PA161109" /LENGTH=355 /DNA_ID=CAMNT_0013478881 /DNA_START=124 /DNA_END=1191 /DNA_ORIENTATION=+